MQPCGLAVEVGAGTGLITGALDSASRVICVDRYPAMLRRLDSRGAATSLVRADATALPLPGEVASVVVAANLLHLVPDADAALSEMSRVTTVDGLIVCTWPDPRLSVARACSYLGGGGAWLAAARFVSGHAMLAVLRGFTRPPAVRAVPEDLVAVSHPVVGGLQRLAVLPEGHPSRSRERRTESRYEDN